MRPRPGAASHAAAALLACAVLGPGCGDGAARPARPATTREALATLRGDLARQLATLEVAPSGSAAERARLGELATHGRALLRRVREVPAAIAPESLAPFLAPLDALGAARARSRRTSFQGRTYAITSRELGAGDATTWVEIVDPAGSPELLAAFEVERAVAVATPTGGRFRPLELGSFPAVATTIAEGAGRPGLVASTVQVLVGDRLLVAARGTSGVDPATLVALLSRIDLDALARAAAAPSATAVIGPAGGAAGPSDDG